MKNNLLISLKLTLVMILLCAVAYPMLIAFISKAAPGNGKGETITVDGKVVGYKLIGQKFTADKYFHGRPSAVEYNAAASGGSNKGPSNNDYLTTVQNRIDTFLVHNPSIRKEDIPAELVTVSGSGLDPHISPASAYVQVKRIAVIRNIPENKIKKMIDEQTEKTIFGPPVVNVLQLNIALDQSDK